MLEKKIHEQVIELIATAEKIRNSAEELISSKNVDMSRLQDVMSSLTIMGNEVKEIAWKISDDDELCVSREHLLLIGNSLCALAGKIYMKMARIKRHGNDENNCVIDITGILKGSKLEPE